MSGARWKVGELARRTGLTVRTLHHYDEIGLLQPSCRTGSGHRQYTSADVVRLQQILSLRSLGLSLEEIRDELRRATGSPILVIDRHIAQLDARIEQQKRLRDRLAAIAAHLRDAGEIPVDQFLQTIEETQMIERYYTPEQLEQLKERGRLLGEDRIREVEAEWPKLMAEVQAAIDQGLDPADPHAQALARRWTGLVEEFTGGDPGISATVQKMWRDEPVIHGIDTGPVRAMGDYIDKVLKAANAPE